MKKIKKVVFFLMLPMTLFGCGGEESSVISVSDNNNITSEYIDSPGAFYIKHQISLEGAENSDVQILFHEIYKELNEANSTDLAGDKFLIVFVQSDNKCGACDSAKNGFEYLIENESTFLGDGPAFKLKTVFTDETLDEDDWKEEDTVPEDDFANSAFEAFLSRNAVYDYLSEIADSATESSYYNSGNFDYQDDFLEFLTEPTKFKTPTLIQVDFTGSPEIAEPVEGRNPITVYFGVNGDSPQAQADYIAEAWMYKGAFGI